MDAASDAALWAAFHQAKYALLHALEAPTPATKHVLLTPRAERDIARASLGRVISRLEHGLRELESVQKTLSDAAQRIQRRSERAHALLTPCASVPTELLREILLLVLTPEDHATTIRASSVCSLWRSTVLHESSLFSHADWNKWPPWLIQEWCARARSRPLHINIEKNLLQRGGFVRSDCAYKPILEATKPLWGTLHLDTPDMIERDVTDFFLSDSLPSLQFLHYCYYRTADRGLCILDNLMPSVHTIEIEGLALWPSSPLTELVELSITPYYDPAHVSADYYVWVEILRRSPSLVNLTVKSDGGFVVDPHEPPVVIETLQSLKVVEEVEDRSKSFTQLLRLWSLPNLQQITTVNLGGVYDAAQFLEALTLCAPRLASLRITNTSQPFFNEGFCQKVLSQLARAQNATRYVPSLIELHLPKLVPSLITMMNRDGRAVYTQYESLLRALVSHRRLERITVPVLTRACAVELGDQVGSLKAHDWLD